MSGKYAIALSFLDGDRALAQSVADRLSESLSVFIYTDRQVELAGTNGLDSFSRTFASGCDLVVVLYRDGYGQTPWTGVELAAIESRFLREGAAFLFLLMLDDKAELLPWIPSSLVRYSLSHFGFEQAIGAIKARALERGALLRLATPVDRARVAERRIAYQRETKRLFSSADGVDQVGGQFAILMDKLEAVANAIAEGSPGLQLQFARQGWFGVNMDHVAMKVCLLRRYTNTLDGTEVQVEWFNCRILLPGDPRSYYEPPKACASMALVPARLLDVDWCWRVSSGDPWVATVVADRLFARLMQCAEER